MINALRLIITGSLQYLYYFIYILPIDCYFQIKLFLKLFKEVEYKGAPDFGNKICVFCSYPTNNTISNSLKRYLQHLNQLGYSILFISNNNIINKDIEWLQTQCTRIIIRENFGLDFACYKTGMLKYQKQIQAADELLIANDSVIMIKDLNPMFNEMKNKKLDFWGVTESYNGMYTDHHICSYFISISKQIIKSKIFWNFWKDYKLTNSRVLTIDRGEILLSQTLLRAGFKLNSYMNSDNINRFLLECKDDVWFFLRPLAKLSTSNVILEQYRKYLYSTNHNGIFAKAMLAMGMPLIKKDLLIKCNYLLFDIQKILKKVPNLDEVINELLPLKSHSTMNNIKTSIGEK
jgi:hypothetical protein